MSDAASFKKLNSQAYRKNHQYGKSYKLKSAFSRKQGSNVEKVKRATSELPSNWDKYEMDIEGQCRSSTYVLGMDIDMLSILPTNTNQFLLKQDKVFLPRSDCTLNPGEIFELDMEMLNLSLGTIPFHIRIGMSESLVTNGNEIEHMNKKAKDAVDQYQDYLSQSTASTASTNIEEVEIRTDEMGVDGVAVAACDSETKELEDWLDNIL